MSKVFIISGQTSCVGLPVKLSNGYRPFASVALGWLAFVWLTTLLMQSSSAQRPGAVQPPNAVKSTEDVSEIQLSDLPEPPDNIAKLIKQGDVRLITGGSPQANPSTLPKDGRVAGESRFSYRYRYRSRAFWSLQRRRNADTATTETVVNIKVAFRSLKLITSHDVWLRHPPPTDRFWKDRVVQHEFDHVQLSADPRIESQFQEQAKELRTISVALSEVAGDDGRVSNKRVQELIEKRMKQLVDTTADYVRIRYRELDRLTQHGLRPMPADANGKLPE